MRYFTKEWYNDTLIADMCFQLRKTERASVFSESFFQRLYAVEERAYLKYSKRASRASASQYDKDATRREFESNYKENLEFVKANLPSDILDDVKDIRVLALGSATNDIAMRITRFCGKKNRLCEAVSRDYDNASEEADELVGADASRSLISLVGSEIISFSGNGLGDAVLLFSSDGVEKRLVLKDAALIESDGELSGSCVIKHELLIAEGGGFEFSMLVLSGDSSLLTVTYRTSALEI